MKTGPATGAVAISGKTEALARKIIKSSKPVFTFASTENSNLVSLGAKPLAINLLIKEFGNNGPNQG